MLNDTLTDILNHLRQPVASDMRMSIYQYGWVGSKTYKLMEHFTYISSLG